MTEQQKKDNAIGYDNDVIHNQIGITKDGHSITLKQWDNQKGWSVLINYETYTATNLNVAIDFAKSQINNKRKQND